MGELVVDRNPFRNTVIVNKYACQYDLQIHFLYIYI